MAMYRCGSNSGGGVTPTPITPSDSTPAALTANTPVNPTANGYAIASQPQSVTPSASGAAFNSGIMNMTSGGYAYSQQPKLKIGTFTPSSSQFSVTGVGFKPKYLAIYVARTTPSNMGCMYIYNEDFSSTQYMFGSGDSTGVFRNLGETANYRLYSIDNDGFTMNGYSTASWRGTGYYFALG